MTAQTAFKSADTNKDGAVSVEELRTSLQKLIPAETISLVDLKKVMMSFDTNRNGKIEESEFVASLTKARALKPLDGEDPVPPAKPKTVPVKQGLTLQQQLDELDKRVSLKSIFADLPMTEDCKILSLHFQRRFKQEEDKVQSAEYLPIIKALYSNAAGSIDTKDVVTFLDKNLTRNAADVTFELKYISNFIEFKGKSANSKSYLVSTCGLPAEERLLEANVITSLSRAFGVSAQVAAAIYQRVGKGGAFTVSDLAKEID